MVCFFVVGFVFIVQGCFEKSGVLRAVITLVLQVLRFYSNFSPSRRIKGNAIENTQTVRESRN